MDKSDVIKLVKETPYRNEYGVLIPETSEREVFCNVKAINQNEFFKAGEIGLKPQFKFIIANAEDYEGEKLVIYQDKQYSIYRTYIKTTEAIELYVEEKVGVKNGTN